MTQENKLRKVNKSRGIKRGPYPQNWCTGPDPRRHAQYYAWLKHKSQAHYRGELHELTWDNGKLFGTQTVIGNGVVAVVKIFV